MRKASNKTLKKNAWKAFSDYIRTRDCIKTTNTLEECICVTCGKRKNRSDIQAGHAIGGRYNSILFDEELVNGQCSACNGYGGGRYAQYSLWFIKTYGIDEWEKKVVLSHQLVPDIDFSKKMIEYKEKLAKLIADYNEKQNNSNIS